MYQSPANDNGTKNTLQIYLKKLCEGIEEVSTVFERLGDAGIYIPVF